MKKVMIGLLALFTVAVSGCDKTVNEKEVINSAPSPTMLTSPNDGRSYEIMTLENGMKVLLVSDPKAEDSAVTIDVHVGSYDEPSQWLGLAHFTEHMLFIGTDRYPEPGEYRQYVQANGGQSNAYTAGEDTVYFFSIKPYAFEEGLDRFSRFFIAPTFEAGAVDKELNAVDSEYQMRKNDDGMRLFSASMLTAHPDHPASQFHAGNRETLSGDQGVVLDQMIDFYQRHYSADKMTLSIVSPHDLSTLKALAIEKFSEVPKRVAVEKAWPMMFGPAELKKQVTIEPKQQLQQLEVLFPTCIKRDYQAKPVTYIAELVNTSSPGGLKHWLKDKEWISDLAMGYGKLDDQQDAINLSFVLTTSGLAHTDDIIEATFAYLDFIKNEGVEQWVFDEIKANHLRAFRFQDYVPPQSYSLFLATGMQEHPPEQVIQNTYLTQEAFFQPQKVQQILAVMTPENMRITLTAKGLPVTEIEPYFEVPYGIEDISESQLHRWKAASQTAFSFALDAPNPFLPTTFDMAEVTSVDAPRLLPQDGATVWYHPSTSFGMPKVSTSIGFWTPRASQSPTEALMSHLFVMLVAQDMETQMRHVGQAGASGGLRATTKGLTLSLTSFRDQHEILVQLFVDTLLKFGINDQERFDSIVEQQRRAFDSYHDAPPYVLAGDALEKALMIPTWTPDELKAALGDVTLESVLAHGKSLIETSEVEMLVHGNMNESDTFKHVSAILARLTPYAGIPDSPGWEPVFKVLPQGASMMPTVYSTSDEKMVMLNFCASGPDLREHLHIALLARMMSAPFFSQLRTEEQLGYVVHLGVGQTMGVPRLTFLVQSPHVEEDALEVRIHRFIHDSLSQPWFSRENFEKAKQSYMADLTEPFKTLAAEHQFVWSEIVLSRHAFDLKLMLAAELEPLSFEDVGQYYKAFLTTSNKSRLIEVRTQPTQNKDIIPYQTAA
jgi:secreted Zn-dependent insulinase-like peptidase